MSGEHPTFAPRVAQLALGPGRPPHVGVVASTSLLRSARGQTAAVSPDVRGEGERVGDPRRRDSWPARLRRNLLGRPRRSGSADRRRRRNRVHFESRDTPLLARRRTVLMRAIEPGWPAVLRLHDGFVAARQGAALRFRGPLGHVVGPVSPCRRLSHSSARPYADRIAAGARRTPDRRHSVLHHFCVMLVGGRQIFSIRNTAIRSAAAATASGVGASASPLVT